MHDFALGFSGTKQGLTLAQRLSLARLVLDLNPSVVFHGGCAGADSEFDLVVSSLYGSACTRFVLPGVGKDGSSPWRGTWAPGAVVYGEDEYLRRDRQIAEWAVDGLIACPKEDKEQRRSGTWTTVRYARGLQRPVFVVTPSGAILDGSGAVFSVYERILKTSESF